AAFAADTGIFHAAEGRSQVTQKPAVYPDDAGFEFGCDAVRAGNILRPNRRRKSVSDAVRVADHFVFGVNWHYRHDRAEDLFLIRAAVERQAVDDRWSDKISFRVRILRPGRSPTTPSAQSGVHPSSG